MSKSQKSSRVVFIDTESDASSEGNHNFGVVAGQHQINFERLMRDTMGVEVADIRRGESSANDRSAYKLAAYILETKGTDATWRDITAASISRVFMHVDDSEKLATSILSTIAILKSWFETFVQLEEVEENESPNDELN